MAWHTRQKYESVDVKQPRSQTRLVEFNKATPIREPHVPIPPEEEPPDQQKPPMKEPPDHEET